jgi:hypothetical protein
MAAPPPPTANDRDQRRVVWTAEKIAAAGGAKRIQFDDDDDEPTPAPKPKPAPKPARRRRKARTDVSSSEESSSDSSSSDSSSDSDSDWSKITVCSIDIRESVRALFIGISECTKRILFFVGNIIKTRLLRRGPNGLDAAFSTFVFPKSMEHYFWD